MSKSASGNNSNSSAKNTGRAKSSSKTKTQAEPKAKSRAEGEQRAANGSTAGWHAQGHKRKHGREACAPAARSPTRARRTCRPWWSASASGGCWTRPAACPASWPCASP
eukprot:362716-Chlamydomonas_euryale.AAC.5